MVLDCTISHSETKHRNTFFLHACVYFVKTASFQTGLMITRVSVSGHVPKYKLIHINISPVREI